MGFTKFKKKRGVNSRPSPDYFLKKTMADSMNSNAYPAFPPRGRIVYPHAAQQAPPHHPWRGHVPLGFAAAPPPAFMPPPQYRQPRPLHPRFPYAGRTKAVRQEGGRGEVQQHAESKPDIVTVPAPVVPAQFVPSSSSTPPPPPASSTPPPAARQPRGPPREPDQRSRRVLARDHSFCYRCARTGHYTKDCMWFKTQLCKYWQEGSCRHGLKNGENVCMYAHGDSELRPVTQAWCIRVVHDNGNMLVFGCGAPFHTPEMCSIVQQQAHASMAPTTVAPAPHELIQPPAAPL